MKSFRIASLALASTLVPSLATNAFAQAPHQLSPQQASQQSFLGSQQAIPVAGSAGESILVTPPVLIEGGLDRMVASLREEMEKGETKCDAMLQKLNAALKQIDAKLDQGVPDEQRYLDARDAISKMRYELKCVATKMTQRRTSGGGMIRSGGFGGGGFMSRPLTSGGAGGGFAGGGGTGGGGIGMLPLLIGGAAGIAAATDDDDDPGPIASVSTTN